MNISSLREFIVLVPTCSETDSLASLWRLFKQSGAEQIVVLGDRNIPQGILKLCQFVEAVSIDDSLLVEGYQQNSLVAHADLIQPLIALWADSQFNLTQLKHLDPSQPIVLVDSTDAYLGLLDRLKLWQQVGQSSAESPDSRPEAASEPRNFPDPLIDLLERLPLPLMLQTSAGRVITQNLAWRQQVGGLQHPRQIRRAAARILEASLAQKLKGPSARVSSSFVLPTSSAGSDSETHLSADSYQVPMAPDLQSAGSCQLGTAPNTCICICPMKDGRDRVWQFVKVPMGVSTARAPVVSLTTAVWEDDLFVKPSPPAFKLASLKFSPDPDWRSLMQTETLWLILAQDITEQQQVAKELAAKNADLMQLNRLKDEFLACISHELKTPLTAVLGMSSLLKDQLLGDLNERQAHYAQLIYRSGRHLVAIVNNILDLTRIETGQLELLLEPVHIPSLCRQAYEQAQQQYLVETNLDAATAAQSGADFQLQIQPELQQMIADELRLRQMLTHLLSNAIKFTEQGKIGLQVENWEGWIAFTVWDTGIGIPPEKQHLIFQKFQQLEQPLTRQFHGTGLGLVLTQRLAHLHGGDISFTTSPHGSQFTLLLPPVPPQAAAANFPLEPAPQLSAPYRNRLVLVVDTDASRLGRRVDQLTGLGYRTVVARSGTEAIEKARRLQPTVILLSPSLPLLSGWDVLTLLKADDATQDIPIVVVAVRVMKDHAYQNGAGGFLSLPVEEEALRACLEKLIQPVTAEAPEVISDLTVLHLYEGKASFSLISNQHHCRVLEVADLEQADLLARVWQPDVVLIDRIETDPPDFMQRLSQSSVLVELPLITLTAELTQAANQIPSLSVFPYLATVAEEGQTASPNVAELLQIMQLAAGVSWVPNILVVDCATIDFNTGVTPIRPPVRALVQYLQTAGFRSTVGNNWGRVQHKLQQYGVDLLVLCVSLLEPESVVTQLVQTLQNLPHQPPVIVWHYQVTESADAPSGDQTAADASFTHALSQWDTVATRIMPTSTSILELLAQVKQLFADRQWQHKVSGG